MSRDFSSWVCDECESRAALSGLEAWALSGQHECGVCGKLRPCTKWGPPEEKPAPETIRSVSRPLGHVRHALAILDGDREDLTIANAAAALRFAEQDLRSVPELGWVIEHADAKNGSPLYFAGVSPLSPVFQGAVSDLGYSSSPSWQWSYNPDCAIRFAREEDAKKLLPALPFGPHRVCEHQWG
jgi:hypothetical protein